jgi:uncharacterized membrane protein
LLPTHLFQITYAQEEGEKSNISENQSQSQQHMGYGIEKINKIDIQINPNGFVSVEENIIVNETRVRIFIPKSVENLLILDSENNQLGYELTTIEEEGQLLTFYLKSPEERDVTFSYLTQSLTRKNASTWTLRFPSLSTPRTTIVKIEFPKGTNVTSLRSEQTLYIYPPKLTSPLFLYPQTNTIYFEIDYLVAGDTIISNDDKDTVSLYILIFSIVLVPLLLLLFFVLFYKRRTKSEEEQKPKETEEEEDTGLEKSPMDDEQKKKEKEEKNRGEDEKKLRVKSSILRMLDENEKKIIKILEKSPEEEITQAYIYKTLGIPKASLSEIIKRLEQRNLIEKKKEGRVNWIKLKKWVFN